MAFRYCHARASQRAAPPFGVKIGHPFLISIPKFSGFPIKLGMTFLKITAKIDFIFIETKQQVL